MKINTFWAYFLACFSVALLISSIILWSKYVVVWYYEMYINGTSWEEQLLERRLNRLFQLLIVFAVTHCNTKILVKKYRTNKLNNYITPFYTFLVISTMLTLLSYTPHFDIHKLFVILFSLVSIFLVLYSSKSKIKHMTSDDDKSSV